VIASGLLRAFIDANRRLSAWLEPRLPQARPNPFDVYDRLLAESIRGLDGPLIADIGGGRSCTFASLVDRSRGDRIVAVDISEEELRHNTDVDDKRCADAGQSLPFRDGEIDLLVSRTVLEHVADVETFVAEAGRVMRDGGLMIHLVPCRYAPFAVLARIVPFSLAKSVLHVLRPDTLGVVEFPVFYSDCYYSGMLRLLKRYGFRDARIYLSYYQSDYFNAFFPGYLVSAAYELAVRWLRFRNLAAYLVIVARR
jgi:ubiquinone/menaquinone biosynthesis C-methylase UbiE